MTTTCLTRQPLLDKPLPNVTQLLKFADHCQARLGYRPDTTRQSVLPRVERILFELNLAPFQPEAVNCYQRQKKWPRWKLAMIVAPGLLVAVMAALVIGCRASPGGAWVWCLLGSLTGALVSTAGLLISPWSIWQFTPLKNYRQVVPRYALTTALEVGERLLAQGIVHEWQIVYFSQIDPFLVLRIPGTPSYDYYLEVWDEPGFELERKL